MADRSGNSSVKRKHGQDLGGLAEGWCSSLGEEQGREIGKALGWEHTCCGQPVQGPRVLRAVSKGAGVGGVKGAEAGVRSCFAL